MRRHIQAIGAISLLAILQIGCGGNSTASGSTTPPVITGEPANATVTAGQAATFSVNAMGTAPLSYQWQKNGTNIVSATAASYTTPATTMADNGTTFLVIVSNSAGSKTSSPATLTVNAAPVAPAITAQPQNETVTVGQSATFSVTATGTAPLSYQWQKNSLNIASATNSSYTTPATLAGDNGATFDVVITNTAGTVTSATATLTVNAAAVAPTITVQPQNQTVTSGQSATFGVTAAGTAPLNYQWQMNSANIAGANSQSYTTPVTTTADSGEQFRVVVSNTAGNITSNQATLKVMAATGGGIDVVTHHYDNSRSGANTNETVLTTANVNSTSFGKLGEFTVDGQIDGQALYLHQLSIPGKGTKNVLYVATENDSVYALDADSITGASATVLWKTSVLPSGETAAPLSSMPCGNINPNGVTATPVIDRARNAIYVVAMSKDASNQIIDRLHALDLTTGLELFGGPTTITATYPGTGGNSQNGTVTFDPTVQHDRAALLESGNTIYTAWSGLDGDCGKYSAWVMAYSADTLAQSSVIDLVPNNDGAGIWMGGGGPAADASGDVYVTTGNGFGDTPGTNSSYGNSLVRLAGSGALRVVDYFTPFNTISDDNADLDLASAAPLLLPDFVDANHITRHLAVAAGKDRQLYVASRDNMGQFNAMQNNIFQEFTLSPNMNFSSPAYFNGTVYICPAGQPVKAFPVTNALLATTPATQSAHQFSGTGAVVSVSANNLTSGGIVWALDGGAGTLYAYDAGDLTNNIYNSGQAAGGRDHFSAVGGHFITPMVTNGRVYFGTANSVVVFGLLP